MDLIASWGVLHDITVPAILPISSLLTFKIPLVLGITGHLKLKEKHLSPHPRLTT